MEKCDLLIIGAGPGGLAAAKGAKEAGAERVIVLERDNCAGGILNQCIHDGFGIIRYNKHLTGPEYAKIAEREAIEAGAEIYIGHQVIRITKEKAVIAVCNEGVKKFQAKAIVLATGCREKTRGAISIPGTRPAGVFTAGVVQNLVNIRNIMPGKRVVILGSGDVGMIMARRLTLEGAEVKAVIEILSEPAGLARNVRQCLYDFNIPIFCSHTVSKIIGKHKIEAVEVSEIDKEMSPIKGTERIIECDALVLSVGLIPENEIAETAGVELDAKSNGALTDAFLQTSIPGIFSCGNSRRIMDLADFVSNQGEVAGRNAMAYIKKAEMEPWNETKRTFLKKGYPVEDSVTCIFCPQGCQVVYDKERNESKGNKCQRGASFAKQEQYNPKRVLTTTILAGSKAGFKLVPVRSESGICKNNVCNIMSKLKQIKLPNIAQNNGLIFEDIDSDGEKIVIKLS